MAHLDPNVPPERYVPPRTNQGWGVVLAIIVLAIVANTTAFMIHERTSSRSPLDPMFRSAGSAPESPTGSTHPTPDAEPTGQGGHAPSGDRP